MTNETWKFVQAKSKQVMKQVCILGGSRSQNRFFFISIS